MLYEMAEEEEKKKETLGGGKNYGKRNGLRVTKTYCFCRGSKLNSGGSQALTTPIPGDKKLWKHLHLHGILK